MAEPAFYGLSKRDVEILRMLVEDKGKEITNARNRPVSRPSLPQSPDVWIAVTPDGGIPALTQGPGTGSGLTSGDLPGYALCQVYRVQNRDDTPVLERSSADLYERVFNLTTTAIPGGEVVLAVMTKDGSWVASQFPKSAAAGLTGGGNQGYLAQWTGLTSLGNGPLLYRIPDVNGDSFTQLSVGGWGWSNNFSAGDLTGTKNNFRLLPNTLQQFTVTGNTTFTGFTDGSASGQASGQWFILLFYTDSTGLSVTFANRSTSSASDKRIVTANGADLVVALTQYAMAAVVIQSIYDPKISTSAWTIISHNP